MDMNFAFLVILCIWSCGGDVYPNRPRFMPCKSDSECPVGFCCRDDSGNLVKGMVGGNILELFPDVVNGTCRRGPSQPGAVCSDRCGCGRGYTCYRTLIGMAGGPPDTCWEAKEAAKDKEHWNKCRRDPSCVLPSVANPGR